MKKSLVARATVTGLAVTAVVMLAGCSGPAPAAEVRACSPSEVGAIIFNGVDPNLVSDAGAFEQPELLEGLDVICSGTYVVAADEIESIESPPSEIVLSFAVVVGKVDGGFDPIDANAQAAGFGEARVSGDIFYEWRKGELSLNAWPLGSSLHPDDEIESLGDPEDGLILSAFEPWD